MDWPLIIMLILGGLVCTGFGWIYFNSLSKPGEPADAEQPGRN